MGEGLGAVFHGADEDSVSFSSDSRESSAGSWLSDDLTDDATSRPAAASPCGHPPLDACSGPLYELSSLMDQLPINCRRGLSKFFSGKSQSFASLSNARCVEDLAKKEAPYKNRTMRPWRSYVVGMAPGPCNKTISKRSPRGSCASLAARRSSSSSRGLLCCSKPPPLPVQKDIYGRKLLAN